MTHIMDILVMMIVIGPVTKFLNFVEFKLRGEAKASPFYFLRRAVEERPS